MMNQLCFNRSLNALLAFKDIPLDEDKNSKYFKLMMNDFTDEEFSRICGDICKTEILYNKYPDPVLFYNRKPKKSPNVQIAKEKQEFLAKVDDYLCMGYVSSYDKNSFIQNLKPVESLVLQKHGGICVLWSAVNRDEYPRSIDSLLKELGQDFDELWSVDCVDNGKLLLSLPQRTEELTKIGNVARKFLGAK